MSLYLTIDQGNSAAKLGIWRDSEVIELVIEEHLTALAMTRFVKPYGRVDGVMYCSVAERGRQIVDVARTFSSRVMKLTSDTPVPIAIDYRTPETLGADRVAAAVGAWAMFGGERLLVVDAGTAVTYDAVSTDGHFLGGNIAPGMRMRLEALHRYTARLPKLAVPRVLNCDTFLGNDTRSAMIRGAVYGIVGAISYYRHRLGDDTRVVMTGGWARELSGLCDFEVSVEPDLVSKGLNRILQYNENK